MWITTNQITFFKSTHNVLHPSIMVVGWKSSEHQNKMWDSLNLHLVWESVWTDSISLLVVNIIQALAHLQCDALIVISTRSAMDSHWHLNIWGSYKRLYWISTPWKPKGSWPQLSWWKKEMSLFLWDWLSISFQTQQLRLLKYEIRIPVSLQSFWCRRRQPGSTCNTGMIQAVSWTNNATITHTMYDLLSPLNFAKPNN